MLQAEHEQFPDLLQVLQVNGNIARSCQGASLIN